MEIEKFIDIQDAIVSEEQDILSDSVLNDLMLLARGDIDMVENAINESLELKRCGWFWLQKIWTINIENVIKKILERRGKIDNLQIDDTEDQINN